MAMEFWIIGAALIITAILITRKMDDEVAKGNMMGSIIGGMWIVVLVVLADTR